ncbi:pentapeptide repeat-containing protein [Nostocaceae cyanobacterium CENA369]|uniref:Pentapeptide repeat-containing protein n=1 Tax=Dendronalium phyllosphericum CENA369 TaxID=1725256 RepID=A0A8J7I682_9NOST|nr:pentapeptide repeat-containing protein [Dendronalium phyllosphericum]MBH8574938.1 pentapeptide repeat-containing protein [Dendronalium phyllosphericum CENA369]
MPQDYSGQNLRGRSFKGQNLEGANFSGADIRSTDFTGANLQRANFSHATAGLQRRWAIFLVCVSWLLSGVLGFFSVFTGTLIASIFDSSIPENQVAGCTALIVVIVVFIVILRQGFNSAIAITGAIAGVIAIAITIATAIAGVIVVTIAITGARTTAIAIAIAITIAIAGIIVIAIAIAGIIAITIAEAITIAITIAIAGIIAIAIAITIAIAIAIAGGITIAGAITRAGAIVEVGGIAIVGARAGAIVIAIAIAGATALFSGYIAWRAMKGDEKYSLIQNIAVAFAAFGGTSFRNADLTDANFTTATFKSTDFRKAILTHTCFNKTKKLDRVRPGTTYLQNAQIRQVLVAFQGQEKNFDREDLRGVNFQGSNLVDASFIGADLSKANLKDADLSRAKLVQAQLNGTDFTGATLTGAYIQDWGITTDTKFDGVRCEYVYMRLPTKENPDPLRKPDNNKEVFADGEFGDFIQPIFDTLDLYHNQGVDPRAIATAFKELAENNPNAELEIVAIERRGEDKVLLRAQTAATANKSELSKEYFINYNQLKALAEKDFKTLIADKEIQIRRLENMITTALERPSFYAQTYNNQGDTTVTGDRNINTGGGNYNERIERDYIQGNYYAAGQPQSLAEAAAEIQQLLKQLEQTYPTTTTSQKMVVAAEAINRIESNPTLKRRVINAVKEGGLAAFEKAIDNPAGAFIVNAIKGWQEVDAED